MKRFISYVLILLFLVTSIIFFLLLNFRLAFDSAVGMKSLAADSGLYDFATTYIRDEVIKHSNISINDDASYTKLNDAFSKDKVTASINSGIDALFAIIDGKSTITIIPISIKADIAPETLNYTRSADLAKNPAISILRNINQVLLALVGIALIFLLLAVLIAQSGAKKLRTFGKPLIALAVSLGAILVIMLQILPDYLNRIIAKTAIVHDARLINAGAKLISAATEKQVMYFAIEILSLLVAGIVLTYIARSIGQVDTTRIRILEEPKPAPAKKASAKQSKK